MDGLTSAAAAQYDDLPVVVTDALLAIELGSSGG
jgi:hypothetical protein